MQPNLCQHALVEKTARGRGVPRCPLEVIWAFSSCWWFWDLCIPHFPGTLQLSWLHLCPLWKQLLWEVVYLMGATQPKQLVIECTSLLPFPPPFEYVHLVRVQTQRGSDFWGSSRSRGKKFCVYWPLSRKMKVGIWMWLFSCPTPVMCWLPAPPVAFFFLCV